MELIGNNNEDKNKKLKKVMIIITTIIVLLFIASIGLIFTIFYLNNNTLKFYIDDTKVETISSDMFVFEEGKVYVSIKDIAPTINYDFYNGGYKQYSEDITKCYIESDNEICTFEKGSNLIYKTSPEELDYQYFTIDEPIKQINDKLYITTEGLNVACNLKCNYKSETSTIKIYTLSYFTNYYMANSKISAIKDNFNNQKALLYGLLVVQNIENTNTNYSSRDIRYGVCTLDGKEIIGTKYTQIEFIESTQEFIVKTTENKVGIITSTGNTKVSPQYDSLKQIDKDLNLYLATNNNKQGVIEKNGKILIYLEYDQIGVDTTQFQNNNIKNSYVLFNNIIPVKKNDKWGMYDIKGNLVLPLEYDGIGCINQSKTLNSILVIPEVNGIAVSKIYELANKSKTTLYGIVNAYGRELVPVALETIYSVTNNGRDEYTMIYEGKTFDVIEYIYAHSMKEVNNQIEENIIKKVETNTEITNEV